MYEYIYFIFLLIPAWFNIRLLLASRKGWPVVWLKHSAPDRSVRSWASIACDIWAKLRGTCVGGSIRGGNEWTVRRSELAFFRLNKWILWIKIPKMLVLETRKCSGHYWGTQSFWLQRCRKEFAFLFEEFSRDFVTSPTMVLTSTSFHLCKLLAQNYFLEKIRKLSILCSKIQMMTDVCKKT